MPRPRLNLDPDLVIETVRRLGNLTYAAEELGCSPAYVANSLFDSGTSLADLLSEPLLSARRKPFLERPLLTITIPRSLSPLFRPFATVKISGASARRNTKLPRAPARRKPARWEI